MNSSKRTRPLLLFYILVIYVFIQFGWWAYLLIRLNNNVALVSQKVLVLKLQEATINKTELLKEEDQLFTGKKRKMSRMKLTKRDLRRLLR